MTTRDQTHDQVIARQLGNVLDHILAQRRWLRFWRIVAVGCLMIAATLFMVRWINQSWPWDTVSVAAAVGSAMGLILLVAWLGSRRSHTSVQVLAGEIESVRPALNQRLLTALEVVRQYGQSQKNQSIDAPPVGLSYMQQRVVRAALADEKSHHWSNTIIDRDAGFAKLAVVISALLVTIAATYATTNGSPVESRQLAAVVVEGDQILVEPGDVEIERGTNLVVTARFAEDRIPTTVELVAGDAEKNQRLPMQRNLADPIFGGYLTSIDKPLSYHVEAEGRRSPGYKIQVFEYPEMVRCDAQISPPSYTSLPKQTIEDTLRVTVVEGTKLRWSVHVNKPIVAATLTDQQGVTTDLVADPDSEQLWTADFELTAANRWELKLTDDRDRQNQLPPSLVARVQPNRPAELKLAGAGDAVVSPIEEFPVSVEVNDDYGLQRVGLEFTVGSEPPREIELMAADQATSPAKGGQKLEHLIDLESLNAQPDQLVSYHFWAEDIGPDGNPRRTMGDLFFAEVRPFEQIFREGSAPGGASQPPPSAEQQQQAQQADELGELQKEIVAATWNLIRRVDLGGQLGETTLDTAAVADVDVINQSQQAVIEQLAELTENLPPDRSPELVTAVEQFMNAAVGSYDAAFESGSAIPLDDALAAARGAYQALLRLRAREFDVVPQQSQQSQSSGGASRSNMQKQLEQLELKNDPNRYEQQQTAQDATPSAAQEASAVLSRLKDLARRQADLNEQLKNAEFELQKAETEEEKEEIARKLERLREQQQELLRDADELTSELDEKQDDSFEKAAEQLKETRENLRDAQQALENQKPSEALTAGSRAERSLVELQEDFQQESSAKISQAMKEISQQSEQLTRDQQQIREELEKLDQPQDGPGLRATENGRDDLVERMNEQAERFDDLVERVRETVRDSEENQPLLANELYEIQREAQQNQIAEELQLGANLLQRGFDPSAMQATESAGESIEQLDRELQSAASRILGDPTEALAQARESLDQLAEQLATERPESEQPNQQGQSSKNQSSENQESTNSSESPNSADSPNAENSQENQPDDQSQQGQSEGQPSEGQQPGGQQPEAQQPGGQQQGGQQQGGQQQGGQQPGGGDEGGGLLDGNWLDTMGVEDQPRPITGEGFREWSNQLREVEDMLPDSELKSRATTIRDRARELRREITRHSREPQWSEIEELLVEPLRQLRVDVSAELLRRSAERNAVVPMDRDPVPEQYSEAVRKYYEQLGSGR